MEKKYPEEDPEAFEDYVDGPIFDGEISEEDPYECEKCFGESSGFHACPYESKLGRVDEEFCHCCPECTEDCK